MNLRNMLMSRAMGGSSGGVSSWNDLTDKPFEIKKEEITIVPEGGFFSEGDVHIAILSYVPSVGDTCFVTYNGTEYTVIAKEMEGIVFLGNAAPILEGAVDTGEPFFIGFLLEENYIGMWVFDGASEVNASVKALGEVATKLDTRFYDGSVTYYAPYFTGEFLYSDASYTTKVTAEELRKAMNKSIVIIAEGDHYQPLTVYFHDGYGYVMTVHLSVLSNGDIASPLYGALRTAEKENA